MAALLVGGCTSVIADGAGRAANTASLDGRLECVPYARLHSGVVIYGDAYTWWTQAAGRYPRKALPSAGAVMVLFDYAGPERGHLAVVRRLVSPREIRVDHANWLDDGAIYVNDPVVDVSADNDWSLVRGVEHPARRLGRAGLSGARLHRSGVRCWRRTHEDERTTRLVRSGS